MKWVVRVALALACALIGYAVLDALTMPTRELGDFDPVKVLDSDQERHAGVRAVPLRPGESLAFAYDEPRRVTFTMKGVEYPLELFGIEWDGSVGERVQMRPGKCCYSTERGYPTFVERRIS